MVLIVGSIKRRLIIPISFNWPETMLDNRYPGDKYEGGRHREREEEGEIVINLLAQETHLKDICNATCSSEKPHKPYDVSVPPRALRFEKSEVKGAKRQLRQG